MEAGGEAGDYSRFGHNVCSSSSSGTEAKEENKNCGDGAFVCPFLPFFYYTSHTSHKVMCWCCMLLHALALFVFSLRALFGFSRWLFTCHFQNYSTAGVGRVYAGRHRCSFPRTLDPGRPLPLGDTDHNENQDDDPPRLYAWVGPREGLVVRVVAPVSFASLSSFVDGKGNPSLASHLPPRFPRCLIGEREGRRERETERD